MAEFDLIKKAFLIGLGAAAVSVDKIQEFTADLVKRGQMSQSEATQFGDELKARALKEKAALEARISEVVEVTLDKTIKRLGLVTQKDLDASKSGSTAKKPHRKTPKAGAAPAKKKTTAKKPAPKKPVASAKKPAAKKAAPKKK